MQSEQRVPVDVCDEQLKERVKRGVKVPETVAVEKGESVPNNIDVTVLKEDRPDASCKEMSIASSFTKVTSKNVETDLVKHVRRPSLTLVSNYIFYIVHTHTSLWNKSFLRTSHFRRPIVQLRMTNHRF